MESESNNKEFYEKLLQTANSFLLEHKYDSAKDIFSEMIIQYPDDPEGWYGYIVAATENFTNVSVSRKFINQLREDENKFLSLCTDDDKKKKTEKQINEYLDIAYDNLQKRLETINANTNKLHYKQIAEEQIAKREYNEKHKKLNTGKIIIITLIGFFALASVVTIAFTVINFILLIKSNLVGDAFTNKLLVNVIWLLLFIISALLLCVCIKENKKISADIDMISTEFEKTNKERSKKFSKEYKRSQKEYEKLSNEE